MFHVEPIYHHLVQCPVCGSDDLAQKMALKDWFLTGESFDIIQCNACRVCFTSPQPDRSDMARFYQSAEYISHTNKASGLLSSIYKSVRKIALKHKYRIVTEEKAMGSILDIGCGTGHLLHTFALKGWHTKGIEPGEHARRFAVNTFGLDVEDEPVLDKLESESFDVVSMWHVLEHVYDVNQRMKQIYRLLANDGLVLIALPNHRAWDARFYNRYWAAWDVPRHLFHFDQDAFYNLADASGFKLIRQIPMPFDAYYVSLLSEDYKFGGKRYIQAIINGFRSNRNARRNPGESSSVIYLLKKNKLGIYPGD